MMTRQFLGGISCALAPSSLDNGRSNDVIILGYEDTIAYNVKTNECRRIQDFPIHRVKGVTVVPFGDTFVALGGQE